MYELKIRDYCFIAHSLKDEFFGPAKNLHGVTYVIDLVISSENLIEKNIIIENNFGIHQDIYSTIDDESYTVIIYLHTNCQGGELIFYEKTYCSYEKTIIICMY